METRKEGKDDTQGRGVSFKGQNMGPLTITLLPFGPPKY
jgi:hypothetical protein